MIDKMLEEIFGTGLFQDIFNMVNQNIFATSGKYATVRTLVANLYESAVMPVALMLLCIYFLIALMDKFSSENFTWEQMIRQMCMFLLGFALIDKGFELLDLLFQLGVEFVNTVNGWINGGADGQIDKSLSDQIIKEFNDQKFAKIGFIDDIFKFCYLFFPYILSWILGMCVKIICYTRLIEIYIRAAFAPIAFSDFFHNGFQGGGWRFLKSFLAVCLQGAVILCIGAIFGALMPVIFNLGGDTTFFSAMGRYFAILAAAVMLMFKSLSITKEFVGVN